MKYFPQSIIARKRDGSSLSQSHIHDWVSGVVNDEVSDAQIAALNMAILFNGMEIDEIAELTKAMAFSGQVIDWMPYQLNGPVTDKHSTGGVGDKTSFLVAPILAACGCYVPMISGRGLGHTGGTLDKLESIPNFRVNLSKDEFIGNIEKNGLAIVSANQDISPADKRIYSVRDATATVPSEGLIISSILSKKIASGIQNLVMDVKVGKGGFFKNLASARSFAHTLTKITHLFSLNCHIVLSDMSEVLGRHAGNSLEILEIIEWFNGKGSRDLRLSEVAMELASQALISSQIEMDIEVARSKVRLVIDNGLAAEYFESMVFAQSGISNILSSYKKYLPTALVKHDIFPKVAGIISDQDSYMIGMAILKLGGGRSYINQHIDLSVGLSHIRKIGDFVDEHTPLLSVHAASKEDAMLIENDIISAFTICENRKNQMLKNPILEVVQ